MKKKAKPINGQVRKLIDLPENVVGNLEKLAKGGRMKIKPYMEVVLIEHSKNKK